ncbi:ABC transporter permease [Phycisphaeraceae bacterium D3-23]
MSVAADVPQPEAVPVAKAGRPRLTAGRFGAVLLLLIALPCFLAIPWTLSSPSYVEDGKGSRFNDQRLAESAQLQPPGTITYQPEEGGETYRFFEPLGTDHIGRSLLVRCLLGGAISLGIGICAAMISVFIGVSWGAASGYLGGRTDAFMMRVVDIFYGLPYLLLVVMLSVAVEGVVDNLKDGFVNLPGWSLALWDITPVLYIVAAFVGVALLGGVAWLIIWASGPKGPGMPDLLGFVLRLFTALLLVATVITAIWLIVLIPLLSGANEKGQGIVPAWLVSFLESYPLVINLITLVAAIGGVSWLTMARVIRGQVLSLRSQPFIEAARAQGMSTMRIIRVHLLPNLIGPIVVYTTLAVPQAILQESFLSFLGIGVEKPLPSWGQLASKGVSELPAIAMPELPFNWWLLVFPSVLLGLTLMSLNFMGDALRERFDPRTDKN